MGKIQHLAVFVCILSVANAWGAAFFDDFDRPDGNVGNGWAIQTDGTIEVQIVDNEVLIAGEQGTAWARSGISRPVENETKISFDFLANDNFNIHMRIDDAETSAFIDAYFWVGGPLQYASSEDGGWPGWTGLGGSNMVAGEYNTLVLEQEGTEFTYTLNGEVVGTVTNANLTNIGTVLLASDADAGTVGSIHIDNVQIGEVIAGTAKDPNPVHGATDVPRDVVLSWTAGEYAATHDVYFGTNADDVNNADAANPLGVLVSPGQTGTSFDPDGLLEYGQTYYWRIDEVNAPPDSTVIKGSVWSFAVEPFAYPVANITATASSSDKATSGPENTINGSGLDSDDLHSMASDAMWLSSLTGAQPTWIQYEFDRAYKLLEMWVWNYNVEFEVALGFGMRDVTIEYSLDGIEWTLLTDTEFARGPSAGGYAHNTTVDFEGVMAQYVRLTANGNWGGFLAQYGLAEVRFYHVPVQARAPSPASGEAGVPLDVVLDWREGREAVSHDVYLSTDEDAVADGTALVDNVTDSRYQPGVLEFAQLYYWRVDEVNEATDPTRREGDVWSFITTEYVAIDDFEGYTDDSPDRVFQTWIDGFGYTEPEDVPGNGTGSTVGNLQAPFAERTIVNSGSQSMPMEYDNTLAPFYSEAERTWDTPQNWTGNGADTLWVYFHGNAENDVDQLYVAVQDSSGRIAVATHPDPNAVLVDQWQEWAIPLSEFTSAGVNMTSVRKMMIGVGDRDNPQPDGAGKLYIDDIRFGRPVEPIGLVAYYALENNTEDSSGNDHHGVAMGGPSYVDGPAGHGMAMEFDGTGAQYVDLGTFDPSYLTRKLSVSLWAKWNGLTDYWQGLIGKRDTWAAGEMMWQIEADQTTGVVRFQREGIAEIPAAELPIGEWTHVAATFDGTTGKLYLDGQLGGEGAFSFGADTEAAIQFGACQANGGNPFNGVLDEVRLYDVVLSETEILELAGQ